MECEWHNVKASEIVGKYPEKCKLEFCPKCGTYTWHAPIEDKDDEEPHLQTARQGC